MSDDLNDQIKEAANNPKKAAVDGVVVEGHSLKDLIDADKHLSSKAASKKKGLGIKKSKIIPPGTV